MVSRLETENVNKVVSLVRFTMGDNVWVFARYPNPVTVEVPPTEGGDPVAVTFESLTQMDIDYKEQHGGVQDVPIEIRMPIDQGPGPFVAGKKGPDVECEVWECNPDDPNGTVRAMWRGKIGLSEKNPPSGKSVVRLTIRGIKDELDVEAGMSCENECQNDLGGFLCGVDLESLAVTCVISSVDGFDVSVQGAADQLAITSPPDDRYWHRGKIKVNGYSIGVRSWLGPSPVLTLFRQPPAEWVGQVATFYPGCDKTPTTCDARFGQLHRYTGLGRTMPLTDPVIEGSTNV